MLDRGSHIRQGIIIGKLMPAVLAPPALDSAIMSEPDNVLRPTKLTG